MPFVLKRRLLAVLSLAQLSKTFQKWLSLRKSFAPNYSKLILHQKSWDIVPGWVSRGPCVNELVSLPHRPSICIFSRDESYHNPNLRFVSTVVSHLISFHQTFEFQPTFFWVAVISAKNHKRQRRKRQSVTAKREKSQTPKVLTAILTLPNLTQLNLTYTNIGVCDFSRLAVTDWRLRRWLLWFLALSNASHFLHLNVNEFSKYHMF